MSFHFIVTKTLKGWGREIKAAVDADHSVINYILVLVYRGHRRKIELEDKAKVVTSDWGTESVPR